MKTKTKALALFLSAVLLVVTTVFTTMAFLTSTTETVENTFTVGRVKITLDEADVDEYGNLLDADGNVWEADKILANRVTGNMYKLIPGHKYVKDPTIHVSSDSEDCWLFVKVENGLKSITASATIEEQMQNTYDWKCIDETNNIWAYENKASKNDNVQVFSNFTIMGTADVSQYASAKIVITAYAIQADGFDTPEKAWEVAGTEAQNKQ